MSDQPGTDANLDARLRLLHPSLNRLTLLSALWSLALAGNFLAFMPTFDIFQTPNVVWASLLAATGACEFFFLIIVNRLARVRQAMTAGAGVCLLLAVGTSEPYLHGIGSLQLPIMYVGLGLLKLYLVLEPPVNPWNKRAP